MDEYLPIYVLTGVFGAIFIFGPLIVPKSENRELIRACIMMTAFCCWILWVTMYIAQMHPLQSARVKNTTLAYLINSQKTQHANASNSTEDAGAEATEAPATQEPAEPTEEEAAPRASEFGVPKVHQTPTTRVLLPVITTTTQPPTAPPMPPSATQPPTPPPTPPPLTPSLHTDDLPLKPPVKLANQDEKDDKVSIKTTYEFHMYV